AEGTPSPLSRPVRPHERDIPGHHRDRVCGPDVPPFGSGALGDHPLAGHRRPGRDRQPQFEAQELQHASTGDLLMRTRTRALVAGAGLMLVTLAAAGCFNPFRPTVSSGPSFVAPAPIPDSPVNVVLLFKWCWENRDYNKYRTIFTAD